MRRKIKYTIEGLKVLGYDDAEIYYILTSDKKEMVVGKSVDEFLKNYEEKMRNKISKKGGSL